MVNLYHSSFFRKEYTPGPQSNAWTDIPDLDPIGLGTLELGADILVSLNLGFTTGFDSGTMEVQVVDKQSDIVVASITFDGKVNVRTVVSLSGAYAAAPRSRPILVAQWRSSHGTNYGVFEPATVTLSAFVSQVEGAGAS